MSAAAVPYLLGLQKSHCGRADSAGLTVLTGDTPTPVEVLGFCSWACLEFGLQLPQMSWASGLEPVEGRRIS